MKLTRSTARTAAAAPTSALAFPEPRRGPHAADPAPDLAGLDHLAPHLGGRNILDLGCAEGLVLRHLAAAGDPASGHGIDRSARGIAVARKLCDDRRLRFDVIDLDRPADLGARCLRPSYEVVLMLGVWQRLAPRTRPETLRRALGLCLDLLAFRCPPGTMAEATRLIADAGFREEARVAATGAGHLLLFRRGLPV